MKFGLCSPCVRVCVCADIAVDAAAAPPPLAKYQDTHNTHSIDEELRMKAFTRFQKSADGLYVAMIEPDFNVLPLISGFFTKRYADQRWLIYDVKRSYGLLHADGLVTEVELTDSKKGALTPADATVTWDERDVFFERLWKLYFKSTNIESRRNMKLHLQHVPKRYWKYLPEKQG